MQVDGIEKEILVGLSEKLVMTKQEITNLIESKNENSSSGLDNALKSLLEKGYVTNITPLGSSSYAVTTKEIKAARQ